MRSQNREIPVAGELAFFGYALRYGEERRDVGVYSVAQVPWARPPARPPGLVAYVGCHGAYAVPFASIDRVVETEGRDAGAPIDPSAAVARAEFAVTDPRCQGNLSSQLSPFFEAPRWGDLTLWVRRN